MDTSQPGRVLLGGRERYTKGIRDFNEVMPSGSTRSAWVAMYTGGTTSVTTTFVADAIDGSSYAADKLNVYLKKTGSPTGNVTVTLADEGGGNPQAQTYAAASVSVAAPFAVEFDITNKTLSDATTYKVTIAYSTGGTSSAYISALCVQSTSAPYYRVLDNTGDFNVIPFEYRGGFYCVTQPADRGTSGLYQLGTRGLADSNNGALTQLKDSSKNFSSTVYDVVAGDLVKIVAGPGSGDDQPWRSASAAGSDGYVTVSPAFVTEHTANTEYVVLTNRWEQVDVNNSVSLKNFDFYVTDVKVTDRVIHIGAGADDYHHRLRLGNNDGTWTVEGGVDAATEASEIWRADKILPIRQDFHGPERPVYDLYISRKMDSSSDRNYLNNIMKYRTATFWGSPYHNLGQLASSDSWLGEDFSDEVEIYSDRGCAISWSATFTTGDLARKDVNVDMSNAELILFSMYSDTAIDANALVLKLYDADGTTVSLNFPAIVKEDDMHDNVFWYEIALHAFNTAPSHAFIKLDKIVKVVISVAVDQDAAIKIKLKQDGLVLATRDPNFERHELGLVEWVNNMVEYGGGAGQVTRKPWIGTNKNVYYIEDGQLKPIYLKEIEELEHWRNCEMMVVNDVYLYFNQGPKIQSYYSGQLKNVGPDADYGLPSTRQGIPCSGASYPGRVLAAVDAGTGTSSVMYRRTHGWHEFYRAPLAGERIKKIHILARDDQADQVFISEGADVLWVPISLNPETDSDYEHTNFGEIITSRIYGGLRETEKYYHAVTAIQEAHSAGSTYAYIYVDYRTSESPDTWVAIADDFSDIPRERNALVSTNNVSGRWIQFRIRFETMVCTYSPILVSLVLDALERLDVNNVYSYTVRLTGDKGLDMQDTEESQTGVEKLTQLETWVDSPLPLTLNTTSFFENDKLVFIEGIKKRSLYRKVDDVSKEVRLVDLTLIEVA